jgi:hypothetical protein
MEWYEAMLIALLLVTGAVLVYICGYTRGYDAEYNSAIEEIRRRIEEDKK